MIGIGGLARSGKDTLAKNLSEVIRKDLGCNVEIFSFAKGQVLSTFLNLENSSKHSDVKCGMNGFNSFKTT